MNEWNHKKNSLKEHWTCHCCSTVLMIRNGLFVSLYRSWFACYFNSYDQNSPIDKLINVFFCYQQNCLVARMFWCLIKRKGNNDNQNAAQYEINLCPTLININHLKWENESEIVHNSVQSSMGRIHTKHRWDIEAEGLKCGIIIIRWKWPFPMKSQKWMWLITFDYRLRDILHVIFLLLLLLLPLLQLPLLFIYAYVIWFDLISANYFHIFGLHKLCNMIFVLCSMNVTRWTLFIVIALNFESNQSKIRR